MMVTIVIMKTERRKIDSSIKHGTERGPKKSRASSKDILRGSDGKPIRPKRYSNGRPVYSLEDVKRMGTPYSNEPNWE